MAGEVPVISLEAFDGLPSWQGALMALGFILVFYVTCGSFQTSSSRREAVASRHVLRSNVVMMFAVLTAIVVVGGMAAAAGTTAAVCAFCGLVAYFATALVAGGAFAGIVVWGVATMATLHIADAGLGLSELTGIYTLFVVAIVMAYPAFALVFPDVFVNACAGASLAYTLACLDGSVTTQMAWLVGGCIFCFLQMVAHPSYRSNDTAWVSLIGMAAFVVVAHAAALADESDDASVVQLVAFAASALAVLTYVHNSRASVFVRYDPHETRAMVISVAAFLIAVRMVCSGALVPADAEGAAAMVAVQTQHLLFMALGYALTVAVSAGIFALASRWVPEDSIAWRLVIVDVLMLIPFILLPAIVVAVASGAATWPLCFLKWLGLHQDNAAVRFVQGLTSINRAFLSVAIVRALSAFCERALTAHSMTFLPTLATTVDRGSARTKLLSLTFNGGPDPDTTPALLEALRDYKATATFFITADRAGAYPKLVRDIYDEGHEIGILGTARVDVLGGAAAAEAQKASRIIEYVTGVRPTLYRPPVSGSPSPLALQAIANAGYTIVMWSVCPWEWQGTEAQVYERLPSLVDAAGYLVLLHEVIPPTVSGSLIELTNVKCVDTAALLLRDLAGKGMESQSVTVVAVPSPETLP